MRENLPLIADHLEALASNSTHHDQLPDQGQDLPAPLEAEQAKGPVSDCLDETFSFLALADDLGPLVRSAMREGTHPRFSSSGELLDTLHRLRI